MDQDYFKNLLKKYKAGQCTTEELDEFFEFVRNQPDNTLLATLFSEEEEEDNFQDIPSNTFEVTSSQDLKSQTSYFLSKRYYIAASILVFMLLGIAWFQFTKKDNLDFKNSQHVLAEQNSLLLPSGKIITLTNTTDSNVLIYQDQDIQILQQAAHTLTIKELNTSTKKGEMLALIVAKAKRMKVCFADGTNVWLNAESQLEFPTRFAKTERRVALLGEGYFDVYHAKEKPFFVETSQQLIQVYGTRFNVRNYINEDKHSVLLYQGKLSVREKVKDSYANELMLSPGEQVDLYRSSALQQKKLTTLKQDSSQWITGSRTYDKTLLREIFLDLSHQYTLNLDWNNIPHLHFSGKLSEKMELEEIIQVLNKTANIKIKINQNTITF